MRKNKEEPPKEEGTKTELPTSRPLQADKPFEIARSEPMELRHLRQACSSLYNTVQNFGMHRATAFQPLATATDSAAEYNWLLKTIDDFYSKAKSGAGIVKITLVAEAVAFTKEMSVEVIIKDKETGQTLNK